MHQTALYRPPVAAASDAGYTRERYRGLAHSTRLTTPDVVVNLRPINSGPRAGIHTLKAAASVGEVSTATFSGGYLPQGLDQIATVVLSALAQRYEALWVR